MMGTVVEISGQELSTLDSFRPINQVKKNGSDGQLVTRHDDRHPPSKKK